MKDKTYLVKYDIRDGETEYREMAFVEAKTLDKAHTIASRKIKILQSQTGEYRIFKLKSIVEVHEEEAIIALQVYADIYSL